MEALKSSFRREAAAPQQNHGPSSEETAWIVEKGEGFSVDELLNLGEFGNIESAEENEEEVKEAKAEQVDTENDCNVTATISSSPSSSGSALSCEAPPLLPSSISEISLPSHDVEELEWVSFIIDDSSLEFPAGDAPFDSFLQAQTESDDSASCERRHQLHIAAAATQGARAPIPCSTVCALPIEAPVPARAKRSKRSRTVAVGWSSLPFADSFSTTTATTATSVSSCSSASSSLSSCLIYDHSVTASDQSLLLHGSHRSLPPSLPEPTKRKVPKKRSRKPNHSSAFVGAGAVPPSGERRCSHCGVQKTPQWRAGPLGAKTLCNACGVRFKSGRLLPEYRPACSPTFQNAVHSNSHRKVLEMRRKKEFLAAASPPVATC